MAGGKETPRQKMIGMMYLVLTAMLALNVSKDILRAFVAIEDNIQKANSIQVDRGNGFIGDVRSELSTSKGDENKAKREKLQYVLKQMNAIDKETAQVIKFIDDIKLEILKVAEEDLSKVEPNNEEVIIWANTKDITPARLNLAAVSAQDKYDEPMQVLGVNEDLKNPKGKGLELWKKYNDFRAKIVELTGTYSFGENTFKVKTTPINKFADNKDMVKQIEKMTDANKDANLKEDRQILIDLYSMLTKNERVDISKEIKDLHWVGATFDHSPLVAGIASLSSMQQEILSARALALSAWKARVSTGEYSFNKIMPLAYGPVIANSNDEVELQVMMAAFDSDNQPIVTSSAGSITYGDGQGFVKVKVAGGAEMNLTGTVAIKNKSGVEKKENWKHTIKIMKPQGTVSLPEMNMMYRGYANKVQAVASGYDQTNLSGNNVTLTKSGDGYIATPGAGRECSITISGKNSVTNKSQSLGTFTFRVSNLPPAQLYFGNSGNGDKASTAETRLFAKYPPEIPLAVNFSVISWELEFMGRTARGTGNQLNAEAIALLKQARPGSSATFNAKYTDPAKSIRTGVVQVKL